ncbi:MAG: 23S rRNA (uracil(1939)-C(5))-methyltransferase RlmD [Candidatus Eisenbacteria bacterium]|nr:23S rRNA (uracil(1939)-C(5))-methyltransferase RlmD [Candidatus Eisenbacteria bacterium]
MISRPVSCSSLSRACSPLQESRPRSSRPPGAIHRPSRRIADPRLRILTSLVCEGRRPPYAGAAPRLRLGGSIDPTAHLHYHRSDFSPNRAASGSPRGAVDAGGAMRGDGDQEPLRVGAIREGAIEDLAYGGLGILRDGGWVVQVRGAFPGDRVRVRLRRKRRSYFEGELLEILAPSPERIPPRCPHLPLCGGCPLQGLAPDAQTRWKAHQAVELLARIGRLRPREIAEPWSSPCPWYYRNKMEFTFGRRPWVSRETLEAGGPLPPGPALGLHPRGRFQGVFDVSDCRLQSRLSNRIVITVRELARAGGLAVYDSRDDAGLLRHLVVRQAATSPDCVVVIVARHEAPELAALAAELCARVPEITGVVAAINTRRATVAQGDYEIPLRGEAQWRETVAGLCYRIGASSFFQTQTRGAETLIAEVLAHGDLRPDQRVLDLYCGVGAFSLPLAQRVEELWGVELLEGAVEEARANAAANAMRNVRFRAEAVEAKQTPAWARERWDLVLLDPPRSGLHPRALQRLIDLRPPRIVYVSCNPSTLARDAGALVADAGYHARRLRVYDLFPQTPHLESMLFLDRQGA